MKKMHTENAVLPAYWASALVNGDTSGLTDEDAQDVARFLEDNPHFGECLYCSETPEFARYNGLLTECLVYTFPVRFTEVRGELEYLIYPAHRSTEMLPWQAAGLQYTATGYGRKIPTTQVVYLAGRRYRIYCDIFSNIGTCYVMYQGRRVIVS